MGSKRRSPVRTGKEPRPSPPGNPWPDGKPSEVLDDFWITVHAEAPIARLRRATSHHGQRPRVRVDGGKLVLPGGKWLLFVKRDDVDEVWDKIVRAVKQGRLGYLAKVSTARPNPLAHRPGKHVICVYTSDASDRDDIMRVRGELRALRFVAPIAYKPDQFTIEGRYEGSGRVATYFE